MLSFRIQVRREMILSAHRTFPHFLLPIQISTPRMEAEGKNDRCFDRPATQTKEPKPQTQSRRNAQETQQPSNTPGISSTVNIALSQITALLSSLPPSAP